MKKRTLVIAVIILALIGIVAAFGKRSDEQPDGEPVNAQMVDMNNRPVSFEDLKGKVLFVNNWASWCPPCIAEMGSIHQLKEKLKGVDVEFVMVSFDENSEKAVSFMKKRKFDFNLYFPGDEYPYATSSIPATFIIDKNGKTVAQHIGMADYNNEAIANQLKSLANE